VTTLKEQILLRARAAVQREDTVRDLAGEVANEVGRRLEIPDLSEMTEAVVAAFEIDDVKMVVKQCLREVLNEEFKP
jgi:hypothetical protein